MKPSVEGVADGFELGAIDGMSVGLLGAEDGNDVGSGSPGVGIEVGVLLGAIVGAFVVRTLS